MSLPLPQDEWKVAVNANYQELMKTLMNLVTASLVLPFFLVRNFLGIPEGQPIADHLRPSAYWSWGLLFLSLLCGMLFYWASAKFLKVVSGGTESWSEASFETLRDLSASGAVLFFLGGLLTLGWFFTHLGKP